MQTFLPFPDYVRSAQVLDMKRLGKQRVETLQIMSALLEGRGYLNHPATLMWGSYMCSLMDYQFAVCQEWTGRGYQDTCLSKTIDIHALFQHCSCGSEYVTRPWWIGDINFHQSHRSALLRKDHSHYSQYFSATTPDNLPYLWPSGQGHTFKIGELP